MRRRLHVWTAYIRASSWRIRGAKIAPRTAIHRHCNLIRPWGINIGGRSQVEQGVSFKLVSDGAVLSLGKHCFIGAFTSFDVLSSVKVGDHTLIAPGCFLTDHDHVAGRFIRIDSQGCVSRSVAIGSDVWIGAGAKILKGVTIGDGAVIGAGAVVTRDIGPLEIWVGVPARLIRHRGISDQPGESRLDDA